MAAQERRQSQRLHFAHTLFCSLFITLCFFYPLLFSSLLFTLLSFLFDGEFAWQGWLPSWEVPASLITSPKLLSKATLTMPNDSSPCFLQIKKYILYISPWFGTSSHGVDAMEWILARDKSPHQYPTLTFYLKQCPPFSCVVTPTPGWIQISLAADLELGTLMVFETGMVCVTAQVRLPLATTCCKWTLRDLLWKRTKWAGRRERERLTLEKD